MAYKKLQGQKTKRFGENHDFASGYISAKPSMYRQAQSIVTPIDNTRVAKKYNRPATKYRPIQNRSLTQQRDVIKGHGRTIPKENTIDSKSSKNNLAQLEKNSKERKNAWTAFRYLNDYYSAPTVNNLFNIIKENPFNRNAGTITGTPPLPGTMKAPIVDGIYKRGIETAMRTTKAADPLPLIIDGWKYGGKNRKKAVLNYILFNKKKGEKGYYNSLADINGSPEYNKGFWGSKQYEIEGNDVIDAILYGKAVNPKFGLKLTKDRDFGNLKDYINQNYKLKKDNIKIYNIINNAKKHLGYKEYSPDFIRTGKVSSSKGILDEPFQINRGLTYDAGGYNYITGTYEGIPYGYGEDIYKFNPKDYISRNKGSEGINSLFSKFGLGLVDHYTTPIIVRGMMRKGKAPLLEKFW